MHLRRGGEGDAGEIRIEEGDTLGGGGAPWSAHLPAHGETSGPSLWLVAHSSEHGRTLPWLSTKACEPKVTYCGARRGEREGREAAGVGCDVEQGCEAAGKGD